MRTGRKRTAPPLRRADPEYQSWTIHDRPQDRGDYQDGDRSLSNLWRDRPYLDVEQPHMDADPDIDMEESGEPVKRLSTETVVRRAVMELVAESDGDGLEEYYDESGAIGGALWPRVAPMVDATLDLMLMYDNRSQFGSSLESNSVPNKAYILFVADKAEKLDFGYRRAKKRWDNFLRLVPAVSGIFREEYKLELLEQSLGVMHAALGVVPPRRFAGEPKDTGFKRHEFKKGPGLPGGLQEFYEGYVPGEVPRQKTLNIKRLVSLAEGETGGMTDDIAKRLGDRMIVDFDTGKVSTKRLQGLLRYVVDQPDSELAVTIVVGTMVREAIRQSAPGGDGESPVRFEDDGAQVRLDISPGRLLSNMQDGTKDVVEEWLGMAISILSLVDVLPKGEPDRYEAVKSRMRNSLAKMGVEIARQAFQGVHGKSRRQYPGGDEADGEPEQKVDAMGLMNDVVEKFDDARRGDDIAAVIAAAEELRRIMSGLGATNMSGADLAIAKLREVAAAKASGAPEPEFDMKELRRALLSPARSIAARGERAASVTVADIAKRIVSPAKVRVVTQAEAEGGIELGGGETLELPGKYHAARRAIGGSAWASR